MAQRYTPEAVKKKIAAMIMRDMTIEQGPSGYTISLGGGEGQLITYEDLANSFVGADETGEDAEESIANDRMDSINQNKRPMDILGIRYPDKKALGMLYGLDPAIMTETVARELDISERIWSKPVSPEVETKKAAPGLKVNNRIDALRKEMEESLKNDIEE